MLSSRFYHLVHVLYILNIFMVSDRSESRGGGEIPNFEANKSSIRWYLVIIIFMLSSLCYHLAHVLYIPHIFMNCERSENREGGEIPNFEANKSSILWCLDAIISHMFTTFSTSSSVLRVKIGNGGESLKKTKLPYSHPLFVHTSAYLQQLTSVRQPPPPHPPPLTRPFTHGWVFSAIYAWLECFRCQNALASASKDGFSWNPACSFMVQKMSITSLCPSFKG